MMKIRLEPHQRLFFTSDTHYNHTNICRGVTRWTDAEDITRDFQTLDQMNDRIVAGINSSVGQDDILFHLGDWSFGGFEMIEQFRNRINCKNIHLILGNHDEHIERNKNNIQHIFSSVDRGLTIYVEMPKKSNKDKKITHTFELSHYPFASWNNMNKGVIHLFGHVHLPSNLRIMDGKAMDVGIDGNGFDPISLTKVLTLIEKRPINKLCLPKDHHVKRVITDENMQ